MVLTAVAEVGKLLNQEGTEIYDDLRASPLGHGDDVERVCLARAGPFGEEKDAGS
jgi:hypothetical protein